MASATSIAAAFAVALCGPEVFARPIVCEEFPHHLYISSIHVEGSDSGDSDSGGAVLPSAAPVPALLSLSLAMTHALCVSVCASSGSGCEMFYVEISYDAADSFFRSTVGLDVQEEDKVAVYTKLLCSAFRGVHTARAELESDLVMTLVFGNVQGDLRIPRNCTATKEVFDMMRGMYLFIGPGQSEPNSPRNPAGKGQYKNNNNANDIRVVGLAVKEEFENVLPLFGNGGGHGEQSSHRASQVLIGTKRRLLGGTKSDPFKRK